MQDILEQQIADRKEALIKLDEQLAELRAQRIEAVAGLNALESLHTQISRRLSETPQVPVQMSMNGHVADADTMEASANIRPAIMAAFRAALQAYPRSLNMEHLKEAAVHAGPVGESFRTSIYHHEKRGNLEKVGAGEFRATPKTAHILGEPWHRQRFRGESLNKTEAAPA